MIPPLFRWLRQTYSSVLSYFPGVSVYHSSQINPGCSNCPDGCKQKTYIQGAGHHFVLKDDEALCPCVPAVYGFRPCSISWCSKVSKTSPVLHLFRPQRFATAKLLVIQFLHLCQKNLPLLVLSLPSMFYPSHSTGPFTFDVILSKVVPELRWQWQAVYSLVGSAATYHSPAQVLEGEREGP